MSKKDLTKLSDKQLENMLAKKYGVEKYLNQKSQLIDLLGRKGETDIQSGFTGPETEAMSIMLEKIMKSTKKAEGGIVSLFNGGSFSDDTVGDTSGTYSGDDSTSDSSDNSSDEDSAEADAYQATEDYYQSIIDSSPQVRGGLKDAMQKAIDEGRLQDIELTGGYGPDNKTMATGVYSQSQLPGTLGVLASVLGMPTTARTYSGYGQFPEGSNEGSDEPSEMIKKIVEDKKEEDIPLTEAELDYYARGMGTATKPLKSLKDVNEYMSSLIGKTGSPTGAKLSKDKKFLILPNGKIVNLKTGKVQESMSGLELFRGGLI